MNASRRRVTERIEKFDVRRPTARSTGGYVEAFLDSSVDLALVAWIPYAIDRMHRNHKSTKVPNVKLKPQPRKSSSSAHQDEISAHRNLEDQYAQRDLQADRDAKRRRLQADEGGSEDEDGHDDDDDDELPLKGAFFCFTGIGDDKVSPHRTTTHRIQHLTFVSFPHADTAGTCGYKSRSNSRRRLDRNYNPSSSLILRLTKVQIRPAIGTLHSQTLLSLHLA